MPGGPTWSPDLESSQNAPSDAPQDLVKAIHSGRPKLERKNTTERKYYTSSTRELRKYCSDKNLAPSEDLTREELLKLLSEEVNQSRTWVESWSFELVFLSVVLLNAVFIGWEIDHPDYFRPNHYMMLNSAFLLLFTTEIVLKVNALGWRRYIQDAFNAFDVVVTGLAAVQMSAAYFIWGAYLDSHFKRYLEADCVQILRLCRLLRIARIFPQLGRLVRSFFMSFRALSWIFALLLLWFYISACFATVFVGHREILPAEDQDALRSLRERFSSIPLSMFALFEVMTLEGWVDYVRPLLHTRTHLVVFFLVFIFFTAFVMLNLVTAVIVDRTKAAQDEELEWEATASRNLRQALINEICFVLQQENCTSQTPDFMTAEVFASIVGSSSEIAEALQDLGWSGKYLESMFCCADQDNEGNTSLTSLQKLLEISDQPLETNSYMRFQLSLVHRLEHQEKLTLQVLSTLEQLAQQKGAGSAVMGEQGSSPELLSSAQKQEPDAMGE